MGSMFVLSVFYEAGMVLDAVQSSHLTRSKQTCTSHADLQGPMCQTLVHSTVCLFHSHNKP